jgi:hypothetical protein
MDAKGKSSHDYSLYIILGVDPFKGFLLSLTSCISETIRGSNLFEELSSGI